MRLTNRYIIFIIVLLLSCFGSIVNAQDIPAPKGLTATFIMEEGETFVLLKWNEKDESDSLTMGYNVFVNFPPSNELLLLGKAGIIYKNEYKYPMYSSKSERYLFAIAGIRNFPTVIRSSKSEIVEIITPTLKLPNIEIDEAISDGKSISVNWNYKYKIQDLAGFRLYVNDVLKIDEVTIGSNSDHYNISNLESGKYIIQLSAVTEGGIESKRSQKVLVKIE